MVVGGQSGAVRALSAGPAIRRYRSLLRKNALGYAVKRAGAVLAAVLAATTLVGCLDDGLVGKPVPAFDLVTLDGQRVNETTYLGKYLILDLMATWCAPCKLEVAHLLEVQRLHGEKVAILSVSVDPDDSVEEMEAFGAEYGVNWPSALDPGATVAPKMGLTIIPKLLIVDPSGTVVFEAQGEVLPSAISRVIEPSTAPPLGEFPWVASLIALLAGLVAWMNPYRAFHRESPRGEIAGMLGFVLAGLLAWRFATFASTRATLSSLLVGAVTLMAVGWWARARAKVPSTPPAPSLLLAGLDRMYEGAPHFMLATVLALQETSAVGFFAPLTAFVIGLAGSTAIGRGLPRAQRNAAGLAGLALVGAGLVVFGMRIIAAS